MGKGKIKTEKERRNKQRFSETHREKDRRGKSMGRERYTRKKKKDTENNVH